MIGSVSRVKVARGLALVLIGAALGLGQGGCSSGDVWECAEADVSCAQEVLNEADCLARDYCMLGPGCQATRCTTLTNDGVACRAAGVCDWTPASDFGPSSCSPSVAWIDCERPTSESACTAQHQGCNWERTCVLKPRDCSKRDDEPTCQSHPGCKWQRGNSSFQLG